MRGNPPVRHAVSQNGGTESQKATQKNLGGRKEGGRAKRANRKSKEKKSNREENAEELNNILKQGMWESRCSEGAPAAYWSGQKEEQKVQKPEAPMTKYKKDPKKTQGQLPIGGSEATRQKKN